MRQSWGSNTVDFFYDANGMPYAMKYNGTLYYYVTNLQGDVMRVVNASGTVAASYDYDPYGKVISATGTLANINPLRYRGYVYDTETGFYYLQSRYYDPAICRFINADNLASTGQGILGNNMFAYCLNSPINYYDNCGADAIWIQERERADGSGHSGLLVEDSDNNWHFFYWGAKGSSSIWAKIFGTDFEFGFEDINVSGYNLRSQDGVVSALASSKQYFAQMRSAFVTDTLYLQGDYTKTYEYLANIKKGISLGRCIHKYRLLTSNCCQMSWNALSCSDTYLKYIPHSPIPNQTFDQLKRISKMPDSRKSFLAGLERFLY